MSSDYSTINNPYDNLLARESDGAVAVAPNESNIAENQSAAPEASSDVGSGGSVETTAVKSSGTLSDTWINTFLRSTNWQPKKSGFTIDGQTGYAEFANVFITGGITATTGTIGGFDIGSDYIRDAANSMGLASTVSGSDDVRFWAGNTYANRATAPFRVTEAGAVTASNITITGGSIEGTTTVGVANLNIANRGWIQTSVFSVSDADTVAWGAGTFTAADGTAYSISGGNTGNMAAKTYVYLDTAVSTTVYQTTTTATTAIGAGKVLIATAQNGTGEAVFSVLAGAGGQNIDASSIVANSITANELSTSIVYAGTIIIDTSGNIRSGQTAFNTGTGWFLGNDSGTAKLSIGNPAGNFVTWDGSNLVINGYVQNHKGAFGGDGSDGALAITSGTTTISFASANYIVKNYTSISITGTGKLAFSNKATNGSVAILKSQGAVTITSSTVSCIDLDGMGASGGPGDTGDGDDGSRGNGNLGTTPGGVGGIHGTLGVPGTPGAGGVSPLYLGFSTIVGNLVPIYLGAGGGAGGAGENNITGGSGGDAGGGLIIECAGALNITGTIYARGLVGANGTNGSGANGDGAGGGGGAGGVVIIGYNTLTANSSTLTVTGGASGSVGTGGGGTDGGGGGGGAGMTTSGNVGSTSTGGAGGTGFSLVYLNNAFA